MENCLVTKLKGTVDNASLMTIDEIACVVKSDNTAYKMQVGYKNVAQRTVRALTSNVLLSEDGETNWVSSLTLTSGAYSDYASRIVFYVKTDGEEGRIAVNDKYNFREVPNGNGYCVVDGDYSYMDYLKIIFKDSEVNIEMSDFPNLVKILYNKNIFGISNKGIRYDRTKKKSETVYFAEPQYVYFEYINELVDYLEDCNIHTRFNNGAYIYFDKNDTVKTLDSEEVAPYKSRLYDCLVKLLTTISGTLMPYVVLFGKSYTYHDDNLYCGSDIVTR